MRPELPVLSFLCLVLLIALTFLHANSRNVAVIALIVWLLVCSLIQGVDNVLWSGNTAIRLSVWCDITTKLLLGARLAIPAACTCICYHLYFLSANRDAKRRPHRILFELLFTIIVPFIYMALHIIVQNNRFDIAQDFGCVAAIYTSIPAIFLVWIPPLLLSITSLTFASLAAWSHIRRNKQQSDRVCLSSRFITVTFLRPLFTAILISLLVFVISIFDLSVALTTHGGLQPWISFSSVHTDISNVHLIRPTAFSDLQRIEAWWWVVVASTLIFSATALAGLIYCTQYESTRGYGSPQRWFHSHIFRRSSAGDDDEFIQGSEGFSTRLSSRITMPSPTPLSPMQLGSGWDDTFRTPTTKPKPALPPILCALPPSTPSSPSDSGSTSESASSIKGGTALAYLQSPRPPPSPPPMPKPAKTAAAAPRWSTLIASPPPSLSNPLSRSPTDSLLSSPWPQPPSTLPISPVSPILALHSCPELSLTPASPTTAPSRRYVRPPSDTVSLASLSSVADVASTISANAYLTESDILLHALPPALPARSAHHQHRAPFQDAGIPTPAVPPPLVLEPVKRSRSPLGRMPSLESFHGRKLSLGSRNGGARREKDKAGAEAVYMTVVQETQAV